MSLPLHPGGPDRVSGDDLASIQDAEYVGRCDQEKGCGWTCYIKGNRYFIALNDDGLRQGWVWEVAPAAFDNYNETPARKP